MATYIHQLVENISVTGDDAGAEAAQPPAPGEPADRPVAPRIDARTIADRVYRLIQDELTIARERK